jgi:hypothetical protein
LIALYYRGKQLRAKAGPAPDRSLRGIVSEKKFLHSGKFEITLISSWLGVGAIVEIRSENALAT